MVYKESLEDIVFLHSEVHPEIKFCILLSLDVVREENLKTFLLRTLRVRPESQILQANFNDQICDQLLEHLANFANRAGYSNEYNLVSLLAFSLLSTSNICDYRANLRSSNKICLICTILYRHLRRLP